jgi:hypothetical protein
MNSVFHRVIEPARLGTIYAFLFTTVIVVCRYKVDGVIRSFDRINNFSVL